MRDIRIFSFRGNRDKLVNNKKIIQEFSIEKKLLHLFVFYQQTKNRRLSFEYDEAVVVVVVVVEMAT